jgi:4-diphosphocytidyl-2-C-methyl-D-erythritol kinase
MAMDKITLEAPAKLNLWLEVMGRRDDGYHNIFTVMHSAGLCDVVELELTPAGITLECETEPDIASYTFDMPCGEDNLAYRAASAFFSCVREYKPSAGGGVHIRLIKRIPAGAGLGGGSSDAGAVLRGLNLLHGNPIPILKLREAGRGLGADVPFCVSGGTATASGIGDVLGLCPEPPEFFIVIAVPREPVHTGRAYAALDRLQYEPRDPGDFLAALRSGDRDAFCAGLFNRFEDIAPHAARLKERFASLGAAASLMSGSGSAVFGLFESRADALAAEAALKGDGLFAKLCV